MDTLPQLLEKLINQSNLLYIVAVTAALVWLVQPVYKGIYAVLLSVAEDKSVRARLRQTQTALRRGGVASWLCQQTARASTALQNGLNKLYGAPRSETPDTPDAPDAPDTPDTPDAPATTPHEPPENASGAADNTQAQAAASPSTPSQTPTPSLLQRTRPFLTRDSFLVSVCVAMSYSLGFMLFQQYSNLSATNAWRWALTAAYWLMLVVVAGRVRCEYPRLEGVEQRMVIAAFVAMLGLGMALNVTLASLTPLEVWVMAVVLATVSTSSSTSTSVFGLSLFLVWGLGLGLVSAWASVFALVLVSTLDWDLDSAVTAALNLTLIGALALTLALTLAWTSVWALASASALAWAGVGLYFYALWQEFQDVPQFTVPWVGVSVSHAVVIAAVCALLALLTGAAAWKRRKQAKRLQTFAGFNLALLLPLVVAVLFALSLGRANTAQLLGGAQAHLAPQDIGLFEFLNALPQATASSTDWIAKHLRGIALFLLFLVLPLINAVMDWLSVAFSRAQFAKLSRDLAAPQDGSNTSPKNQASKQARNQWPRLSSGLWDIGLDALGAVFFKLVVLGLLTFWAWAIDGRGVSFTWQVVSHYWQMLWPLSPVPFSTQALLEGNNLLISLMVATTLVPTLLHSAWVLLVVSVKGLAALSRSVVFAALWHPKLGAAVLSVLCVCGLVGGVYWANKTIQGQATLTTPR